MRDQPWYGDALRGAIVELGMLVDLHVNTIICGHYSEEEEKASDLLAFIAPMNTDQRVAKLQFILIKYHMNVYEQLNKIHFTHLIEQFGDGTFIRAIKGAISLRNDFAHSLLYVRDDHVLLTKLPKIQSNPNGKVADTSDWRHVRKYKDYLHNEIVGEYGKLIGGLKQVNELT